LVALVLHTWFLKYLSLVYSKHLEICWIKLIFRSSFHVKFKFYEEANTLLFLWQITPIRFKHPIWHYVPRVRLFFDKSPASWGFYQKTVSYRKRVALNVIPISTPHPHNHLHWVLFKWVWVQQFGFSCAMGTQNRPVKGAAHRKAPLTGRSQEFLSGRISQTQIAEKR
jgi:hypothetical protein